MEDHINSNIEPSVPMSVYQELYQELEGHRSLSNSSGSVRSCGSRKTYANMDINSMGVDLDKGPITNLDNKLADNDLPDTNKMSESIAEKTAKLHRLLGESDKEKGFHLDLESPESEKLTDSVSEKEEKDVDDFEDEKDNMSLNYHSPRGIHHTTVNNDIYALPVKRRQKRKEDLPSGWEKHEVNTLIY